MTNEVTVTTFPMRLNGLNLFISLIITRGISRVKETNTDMTFELHGNISPSILQNDYWMYLMKKITYDMQIPI